MSKPVYVYVITDGEFAKVGMAADVKARLKTLQTGNARRLDIVMVIECWGRQMARRVEKEIHGRLDVGPSWGDDPVGEWFEHQYAIDAALDVERELLREVALRCAEPAVPGAAFPLVEGAS